jgi:4-hydroxy-tetrahydrodipicolinate synthase
MAVGGIGVISVIANALPGKLSQMIRFANNDQYSEARILHLQLIDMF